MSADLTCSATALDIKEILSCLPHRHPFLLIDRIICWEAGKSLLAIKNVSVNEPCFTGHFPENPIFPGVLIIEALAQAAGVLAFKTAALPGTNQPAKKYLYVLAGIDKARFKRLVIPGDQLQLNIELLRGRQNFALFKAVATVAGELACSAELLTAIKALPHD